MNRPVTLTIAALGGQGGGVVQEWMIEVARQANYLVQATSVPGVAQRTGATVYYLEFFPNERTENQSTGNQSTGNQSTGNQSTGNQSTGNPVMALMPVPGNCDLVVASELVEAARMVQRGFVAPEMTTLISSTHRSYTIDEKSHLADGRADKEEILNLVRWSANKTVLFDMEKIAVKNNSVVSAAMLGGIAAAKVLPFPTDLYEEAIRQSGRGVENSLAAFRAAMDAANQPAADQEVTPSARFDAATSLGEFPEPVADIVRLALPRLRDYQDDAYSNEYLGRLKPFCDFADRDHTLGVEVAKGLALWMTFEDTIRVADLKTKPERLRQLLDDNAQAGSLVHVTEFMKPRVEELAGTLPAPIGRWLEQSDFAQTCLRPFTTGLKIRSSSVWGYLVLRLLASMRGIRRSTLRYAEEIAAIEAWLNLVREIADENTELAIEITKCQQLITGYGDTRARGLENYQRITNLLSDLRNRDDAAQIISNLREAALKEDTGKMLNETLQQYDLQEVAA